MTNRASDRRLRAQLDHDRELKARERELSLRNDVYLAAAEAVSAGFYAVARFADLSGITFARDTSITTISRIFQLERTTS